MNTPEVKYTSCLTSSQITLNFGNLVHLKKISETSPIKDESLPDHAKQKIILPQNWEKKSAVKLSKESPI